jgi:hypothetical protein
MTFTDERIRAVHWAFDHVAVFTYDSFDDFKCVVDQREAMLLGYTK